MALSVVQTGTASSNTGTCIISFSTVTINNLLVFCLDSTTTAGTIISINDTAGNSYTRAVGTAAQAANVEIWYGVQSTGGATKGTILYGGVPTVYGQMYEIAGASATPLDKTSLGTSNTGTVLSVVSFTPSVGSSIVITTGNQGGLQAWTAGAGFTLAGTTTKAINQYNIFSTGSATIADCHGTQLAAWAYAAANFKDAGVIPASGNPVSWRSMRGVGN